MEYFYPFGEKYLKDVGEINNLKIGNEGEDKGKDKVEVEVKKESEIVKYFSFAGTCAEIVQKILGQDIKIQYKDLFNENWKESK